MSRTPSGILTELLAQHAALRDMIERCTDLADDLDRSDRDPAALVTEIAALRSAFDTHTRYEEQFLRPVLAETDAFADARIDRMVADHVAEHDLVGAQLVSPVTRELRATLDNLRHHLDAEERYFLSSKVLRDDV